VGQGRHVQDKGSAIRGLDNRSPMRRVRPFLCLAGQFYLYFKLTPPPYESLLSLREHISNPDFRIAPALLPLRGEFPFTTQNGVSFFSPIMAFSAGDQSHRFISAACTVTLLLRMIEIRRSKCIPFPGEHKSHTIVKSKPSGGTPLVHDRTQTSNFIVVRLFTWTVKFNL
jgi:hypothetical protein